VAEIDQHLKPLVLPTAGVHGVERRAADGVLRRLTVPDLDGVADLIEDLCRRHPRLLMERKGGAIALHYRQDATLEALCLETMTEAAREVEGMTLLRGKMVIELKPLGAGKGLAVQSFLLEPPFQHRRPWFFGDDVTDEAGFDMVRSLHGVAVKIGEGETAATYRMADPAALHDWMARAVAQFAAPPRPAPPQVSG
jgi:trehalose 6-phosphate phosphatase